MHRAAFCLFTIVNYVHTRYNAFNLTTWPCIQVDVSPVTQKHRMRLLTRLKMVLGGETISFVYLLSK